MRTPSVLLFSTDQTTHQLHEWVNQNRDSLECTVHVSSDPDELTKLCDQTYNVLVSTSLPNYKIITDHIADYQRNQWIDFDPLLHTVASFNSRVNTCFAHFLINPDRTKIRPRFSAFTTTFNTGNKIYRAYYSLLKQTIRDWEWVVVDDSPDDDTFAFLRQVLQDPRVRLYRRSKNSGSIGNVKNEAASLCRGKYVLELDHDDEIMPTLFDEAAGIMDVDDAVGFVYSDFYNIYEPETASDTGRNQETASDTGRNFKYSDFISFGYGGYYCIYVPNDKQWRYVYITPNVNNITASALISLPNHPRIWRRTVLERAGNYSENLPICDDLEILVRTFALMDPQIPDRIKVVKIHKPLYVQYMNHGGNNFSLIRNREINRIGPQFLYPLLYRQYDMHGIFERLGAHEDPAYLHNHSPIWKRGEYKHVYANSVVHRDAQRQICFMGLTTLIRFMKSSPVYQSGTEIIVLDRERTTEELCAQLEVLFQPYLHTMDIRAYAMEDCSWDELERFAQRMLQHSPDMKIVKHSSDGSALPVFLGPTTGRESRHDVINSYIDNNLSRSFETSTSHKNTYLEIGVEWGYTYSRVSGVVKTGVDPSPKWDDGTIVRKTSDEFFESLPADATFDVVFIDGMHRAENVWSDLRNSLLHLSPDGVILIDDVLPQTENEQWRIPRKHVKEDGILKYAGTPWTGDVWKAISMFFREVSPTSEEFTVYSHPTNYRGVLALTPRDISGWISRMPEEIPTDAYLLDYVDDMGKYVEMLYKES